MPFTLVGLLLVGVFLVYPLIRAIHLSFTSWKGIGDPQFVGFNNFLILFTLDPIFPTALRNTIVWTVVSAVMPLLLAIPIAIVLNGKLRGRSAFRAAIYLPAVLSSIVVAMSWNFVYRADRGFLNQILESAGLGFLRNDWLGNPDTALYCVLVVSIWSSTGTAMVLVLAGLQSVPGELVEACRMDGGNRWGVFRHVEVPALRPTLALVVLISVINGLKAFDLIAAMTGGGPGGASQILSYYSWVRAIPNRNVGIGSAIAVILLILSIGVIVPYVRTMLQSRDQEAR